ncbi:hypothetical protein [Vibrio parahaemolyticus]|uniref:hypothetical protein n=1 Tax=Vibrio parahaemolyticus TaxID=670 RepID=UPI00038E29C2|nr:hypothetical protein [Vibrio parahaemolyticus]ANQ55879.1 hypothetical protein AB831_06740 [Vibrio parahaemolyticus]ASO15759.1 hypothetical protein BGM07_016015 [Vibrio parahaemolyticus]AWA89726.1 hypothetical protein BSG32_11980 [Vibrio parahaemolyticus]EGQ7715985.1 hypothetical protein [Vibrio parahaemolyticus]EGQ7721322.1 hypothetical protein [Vibrio parahaemolyticus]
MKDNIFIDEYMSPSIYDHGKQFYNAAKLLEASDLPLTPPMAVCLSFSIEMFLKCLRATQKYTEKISHTYCDLYDETLVKPKGAGHDLVALYDYLPEELTSEMEEKFNSLHWKSLREELVHIKSVFIDWRYIYEGKTYILHSTTLNNVADFLAEYSKGKILEQYKR